MLDQFVLSKETKEKVRKECKITGAYFQVLLANLKKKGVIKNNQFNPKIIPNTNNVEDSFQLLIFFDLNDKSEKSSE